MLNRKYKYYVTLVVMILLLGACSSQKLAKIDSNYTEIKAEAASADPDLEASLSKYRVLLSAKMDTIVGYTEEPMSKGRPESKLGNLLSDIILDRALAHKVGPVDFAVQNLGGIRIPTLGAGQIKKGLIFEIMPFDNEIVVVHLKGSSMSLFMDQIAAQGGIPVSRGVKMHIENRMVASVLINGEAIDPDRIYHIAMPDFMANGGDDFVEFKTAERAITGIFIRDAIIDHFLARQAEGKPVSAKIEKRITE